MYVNNLLQTTSNPLLQLSDGENSHVGFSFFGYCFERTKSGVFGGRGPLGGLGFEPALN